MDKTFGKRVKVWLFVNGMKQGELAKMLNISDYTYQIFFWESVKEKSERKN